MKLRRVTLGHMPKTSVIRFRCDPDLAARFERVAALRRREESDLARIWFEDMVLVEEQRLGLVLSTQPAMHDRPSSSAGHQAAKDVVDVHAAHARGATSAPQTPEKPITYRAGHKTKKKPTP